jgi:hypothetical protein
MLLVQFGCVCSPSSTSLEKGRIPNRYSLNMVLILLASSGLYSSQIAEKCHGLPLLHH